VRGADRDGGAGEYVGRANAAARPGQASAADADERGRVTVLALGVPDRPQGYLAVGAEGELDHHLVAFAASLLTLDRERARLTGADRRWARAAALGARLGLPAPAPTGAVLGPLAGVGPVRALVAHAPLDAVLGALAEEETVGGLPLTDEATLLLVPEADVEDVASGAMTRRRRRCPTSWLGSAQGPPRRTPTRCWPASSQLPTPASSPRAWPPTSPPTVRWPWPPTGSASTGTPCAPGCGGCAPCSAATWTTWPHGPNCGWR
jgi:hypothetical protein